VVGRQVKPRPWAAMRSIASGLTFPRHGEIALLRLPLQAGPGSTRRIRRMGLSLNRSSTTFSTNCFSRSRDCSCPGSCRGSS
jgi:hypothetical protein